MDEQTLIARAKRGDADAFEALVTPYERRLYALCVRMMLVPEDAQDALQEAMLRLWRSLASYEARAGFGTWAYRIAANACLDALRKRKLRATPSLEAMMDAGYAPSDPTPSPQQALEADERQRILSGALAELEPDARAALVLRDLQGESYEQVARILRISLGTAKSRIHRAREKIARILREESELFARSAVQHSEGRDA